MLRDALLLLAAAPWLTAATSASVRPLVASCADGSVVFASKWEDVRCEGAIRVPAGHVPQVGSVWDRSAAESWEREAARERGLDAEIAAAVLRRPAPEPAPARALTLAEDEVRELRRWLEATGSGVEVEHWRGVGAPDRMRLARSEELERRVRDALAARWLVAAGPVLVFHLQPALTTPKLPVPGFAQGGVTWRPDPDDPRELGWLAERRWGSAVGYVGLPADFDASRPMAIFWGDAVVGTPPAPSR